MSQNRIQQTTTDQQNENELLNDRNRRRNFVQWLQRDGIFLLYLLNSHSGERLTIQCLEHLINIWTENYEDKSKLAEQLLRNEFHFS